MIKRMSGVMSYVAGSLGTLAMIFVIVWFLGRRLKKSDDPARAAFRWLITAGVVGFWVYLGIQTKHTDPFTTFLYVCVAAITAVFVGIWWAPSIGELLAAPFANLYDGGDTEPELRPLYSIATGYRKRGNYKQAIAEIRKQLANFPEDFEGWMMLADVQFHDLNNLGDALETVEQIVTLPEIAPKNLSYALVCVADWQLELGNRDAAQAALERVIELLPDSEESQIAAQRIAHLASPEHLANMHEPRKLVVKHSDERIGLRGDTVEAPAVEEPNSIAQRYLNHLSDHPLDIETREKLALLYSSEFKRLDLATGELEQLIATPNQTPKNIAHWLNMLADFQIRLANDVDLARQTLQRVIDLNPNGAAANTARVRLSQLKLELNQNASQRTVKLGNYEQNIGLRRMTSSGTNEG
jgi:tetratricopeptide (TPR) repeat protein